MDKLIFRSKQCDNQHCSVRYLERLMMKALVLMSAWLIHSEGDCPRQRQVPITDIILNR